MPLLNYTTEVAAVKTIGEIQAMLARQKALAILTDFDGEGNVTAVNFRIRATDGILTCRLPANIDSILKVMYRHPKVPTGLKNRSQATRVAWRILKDWLEAQLALIETGMVDMEQVFLPYLQNGSGETVYEAMKARRFEGLALPEKAA